jgi:hypothetical protein
LEEDDVMSDFFSPDASEDDFVLRENDIEGEEEAQATHTRKRRRRNEDFEVVPEHQEDEDEESDENGVQHTFPKNVIQVKKRPMGYKQVSLGNKTC